MEGSRWPGPDNLERIAKALDTTPGAPIENQVQVIHAKNIQEKNYLCGFLGKRLSSMKFQLALVAKDIEQHLE